MACNLSYPTFQTVSVDTLSTARFGLNISDSFWACYILPVIKLRAMLEFV